MHAATSSPRLHAPLRSASSLLGTPHCRRLSFGCEHLDACTGGVDAAGITEIAGEAGTGKTQLALQLMLQAQLPVARGGLAGGCVYLHGDSATAAPTLRRFQDLAAAFAARHAPGHREELQNNASVMQVDTPEELWEAVDQRLEHLLTETPVRLLVIDSIGALYRTSADESAASRAAAHGQRAQLLMRLAARLKQISDRFDLAMIILNQVSDKPFDEQKRRDAAPWELGACGTPDGSARVPALGIAWGSCVNTRLVLTRHAHLAETGGETFSRRLHVAWSPRVPEGSVAFEIQQRGVQGLANAIGALPFVRLRPARSHCQATPSVGR